MSSDRSVEVVTSECVCRRCGKRAILRTRPWRSSSGTYRPSDGKTHTLECPDGHGSRLAEVECRGTFTPEETADV